MKILLLPAMLAIAGLAQSGREIEISTPPTKDVVSLAMSPDGQKIAFVAVSQGRQQLWVHRLDSGKAQPLPGTEYAIDSFPFWSPDSRSVGFSAEGALKSIEIDSGRVRTILPNLGSPFRGASWSSDGIILFATAAGSRVLLRIPASGGSPTPATRVNPPTEALHVFPSFLPGGRHFLYYALGSEQGRGVYVAQTGRPESSVRLLDADAAAVYGSGHIFFVRGGTLFAQAFDPDTLKLAGKPVPVTARVPSIANVAAMSASSTGTLIYRTGFATRSTTSSNGERLQIQVDVREAVDKQFTWYDRSGKELQRVGAPTPVDSGAPSLAADGKTVAFARTQEGNTDIWLLDLQTETFRRFTSDPARDNFPYWNPDGRSIVFSSNRNGVFQLYRKSIGDGVETLVSPIPSLFPKDWSSDGSLLLAQQNQYRTLIIQTGGGTTLVADGTPSATLLVPQLSPDARWIAFQSNASGADEVYIARLASASEFRRSAPVSSKGGAWPMWARDGKELFYVAPDGALMAVPFNTSSGATGAAVRLFVPPMLSSVRQTNYWQQYLVSKDGRFLVIGVQEVQSPIQVIRNWQP